MGKIYEEPADECCGAEAGTGTRLARGNCNCRELRADDPALSRPAAGAISQIPATRSRKKCDTVFIARGTTRGSALHRRRQSPHTQGKSVGRTPGYQPFRITIRGVDLNSFDHFIRQINEPDGERVASPPFSFP